MEYTLSIRRLMGTIVVSLVGQSTHIQYYIQLTKCKPLTHSLPTNDQLANKIAHSVSHDIADAIRELGSPPVYGVIDDAISSLIGGYDSCVDIVHRGKKLTSKIYATA